MHELEGPEPMHRQIGAQIEDGTYRPNTRLPSEAEVCARFDVSRRTAREAYAILIERDLVVTSQGKGTYVKRPEA